MNGAYLALLASGELAERARKAQHMLRRCVTCPRNCRPDRTAGELGSCGVGALAQVASYGPHFGEERPLVGQGGSGTIFFAGCNLKCVFCQNHDISQPAADSPDRRAEWETPAERLVEIMLELQDSGCENINLVSPSHVVPQILAAVAVAAERGLRLPLVYNSGGYDALHTLRLLDGVVDIYMPDMKYSDDSGGRAAVGSGGLPGCATGPRSRRCTARWAICRWTSAGVATRGLLVRHLVLPDDLAGTADTARFLAEEVSRDTYINVMDQYRPAFRAAREQFEPSCAGICRPASGAEYRAAVAEVRAAGLRRLDGVSLP